MKYFIEPHNKNKDYEHLKTIGSHHIYHNDKPTDIYFLGILQFKIPVDFVFYIDHNIQDQVLMKAGPGIEVARETPLNVLSLNPIGNNIHLFGLPEQIVLCFHCGLEIIRGDKLANCWIHQGGPTKSTIELYNSTSIQNEQIETKDDDKCRVCGGDTEFISLALKCIKCGEIR
jgi:hypothetical protein